MPCRTKWIHFGNAFFFAGGGGGIFTFLLTTDIITFRIVFSSDTTSQLKSCFCWTQLQSSSARQKYEVWTGPKPSHRSVFDLIYYTVASDLPINLQFCPSVASVVSVMLLWPSFKSCCARLENLNSRSESRGTKTLFFYNTLFFSAPNYYLLQLQQFFY